MTSGLTFGMPGRTVGRWQVIERGITFSICMVAADASGLETGLEVEMLAEKVR